MKPHQRRQARWFETFGCASPSRSTSSPTVSSPSSRNSSRIRTRVWSPSPRKYVATRSLRTARLEGETERRAALRASRRFSLLTYYLVRNQTKGDANEQSDCHSGAGRSQGAGLRLPVADRQPAEMG